ncbi:SDR family oxidoreductase [Methylobacterium radiodurans]|uniref:SDR family oxidoreductase n=1 Tax=Methylobacterium radiodurans TaxID=2202828 RepID=A0A2U8VX50_9HYPH|nr:SDR family oxidoreductase [Methylobacterium radiodurans]
MPSSSAASCRRAWPAPRRRAPRKARALSPPSRGPGSLPSWRSTRTGPSSCSAPSSILVARDAARLRGAADPIGHETGVAVDVMAADLTLPADLAAVRDRVGEDSGLGFLVNCAGLGPLGPSLHSPAKLYDRMLDLNVRALQTLTFAAARAFAERGGGTIVNVASAVALNPECFNAGYAAQKAFVLALTQGLVAEMGGKGVRLQAVLPGVTRTEFFERAGADIGQIPAEMIMEAHDLVVAALAGLDAGEIVTILSLTDCGDWQAFEAARFRLGPILSHRKPAARYGLA